MIPIQPRIKICGVTRCEDALLACQWGADALGFVFYEPSPRAVTVAQAQAIFQILPPFVTTVGLFVDATVEFVQHVLQQIPLDRLQFHGDESPEYCHAFARPYIKALRVRENGNITAAIADYPHAQAILLDTYVESAKGGTGVCFNWQYVPRPCAKPIILAGGLTPENVSQAIQQVSPYGVDVSGGVETAKGIKSAEKMAAFIRACRVSS
ncbi:phosphoribosylanthranilate isomerase [Thioflexithrix psekupsensis]|uniref:N-(5'-phosphoribosyl)anthranilate isomerase n=1 Tax=Thioflexithrix psekupsensis TaxID=1570016 RepID=A0A251XAZ8_9GAMM|nr:phosphoribosylanthranilate isomerase [Thioflexithrix psekupsensis]OUD15504.1 N-(5'-phosphoribosyl)anthranilate isomerase [Thioflexithrix psekupsensis]